jgi:TolA-binding protein
VRETNGNCVAAIKAIDSEISLMKTSLTKSVGENKADLGVQIQTVQGALKELQGKLEEQGFQLDALAADVTKGKAESDKKLEQLNKMLGVDTPVEPSKIPADKEKHWEAASSVFLDKKFETARQYFREYAKRYPDDPLADDALLMVGMAYLEEGRGAKALGELQKLIDTYPSTDRMDAVLYYMGEAFFMIQNCADARTLFKSVINQYPKSPFKEKSVKKVQEILKAPKTVCP